MKNPLVVNSFSVLVFRVCLSGIFISAGISHLIKPEKVAERIHAAAFYSFASFFGDPYWLGLASGYVLLIGGIGLLLGLFTRWAAVFLFLVLIPITITIQLGNGIMHGPLWKNVALFGGLVFFIVNNPTVYSIYKKKSNTMKTYIILILVVLSVLGTNSAKAQTAEEIKKTEQSIQAKGKYAILVMKAQHLKAAVLTGKNFKAKSSTLDFQIITCGALVKEIAQDPSLQELITAAVKQNGLKIVVCGLSIQQLDVNPSLLPKEAPITDNGLIYLFGLEELDYKTISL